MYSIALINPTTNTTKTIVICMHDTKHTPFPRNIVIPDMEQKAQELVSWRSMRYKHYCANTVLDE